jgi:putative flippase GtrA
MSNTPQFLRFILVGGSTAALNLGLMLALVEGAALQVTLASTITCIVAICYNYFAHYHWTFTSDLPHGRSLVRYLVMCAAGVSLNGLIMHIGAEVMGLQYMLVQITSGVILVCWSVSMSSIWVFKKN